MPAISVIIPTWNRSSLLIPTLQSALWQTYDDFEIIIVGDGCTDDTADIVRPFLGEKVRWINLSRNTGIQSFPNNVGIASARGEFIAYLGHDDIWDKDHLSQLMSVFNNNLEVDFAVAGMIIHGPADSEFETILGLFDNDGAKFTDVFAPSSIMHRRSCVKKFGLWRSTEKCRAPVDVDFHGRAARSGCRYMSTQRISSHKISAAQRYLYYLNQSSTEQQEMLVRLSMPKPHVWINDIVERCKKLNRYMVDKIIDYSSVDPGAIGKINRVNRGLKYPPLQRLRAFAIIDQKAEIRGYDWFELHDGVDYRWAGPNPRPKILIPYTSTEPVQFGLVVPHINDHTRSALAVRINGRPVSIEFKLYEEVFLVIEFKSELLADKPSIIELFAPLGPGPWGGNTLAIGRVLLAPTSIL